MIMTTISITDLSVDKVQRFDLAFRHALASKKSEETFAQIIGGLPTRAVSLGYSGDGLHSDIYQRMEPSESSVQIFREFLTKLQTSSIQIDAQVSNSQAQL
jgi:hypothetical protein